MKKRILFVGIGGVGCRAADTLAEKSFSGDVSVFSVALDTDKEALDRLSNTEIVSLSTNETLADTLDRLGPKVTNGWFPEKGTLAYGANTQMDGGAGLFRMKAAVAYADFTESENSALLDGAIRKFLGTEPETVEEPAAQTAQAENGESAETLSENTEIKAEEQLPQDPETAQSDAPEDTNGSRQEEAIPEEDDRDNQEEDPAEEIRYEVYVASSLAGGTGSALFLPAMLDIRSRLAGTPAADAAYYAMLTSPEIYAFSGTELEKTKMYGNAYAAMRELLAALSLSPKERERLRKWVCTRFRPLVDEMDRERLFDWVYLFGRVPGVSAPDAYERMIAGAVAAFANGTVTHPEHGENSPKDAIFAEISLAELTYPAERVTEYVVLRATFDLVNKKMEFYRSAVSALASGLSKSYRGSAADAFLSAVTGREDFVDLFPYVKLPTKDIPQYDGEKITAYLSDLLLEVREWQNLLPSYEQEAKERIESLKMPRMFDSYAVKKQKRSAVTEAASALRNALEDAYHAAFDGFREKIIAVANAATGRGEENAALSVYNALLSENGKLVHPATAVFRLCSLQKAIEEILPFRAAKQNKEKEKTYLSRLLASAHPARVSESYGESERIFALSAMLPEAYVLSKNDMRYDVAYLHSEWKKITEFLPSYWMQIRKNALLGVLESRVGDILSAIPAAFRRYLREVDRLGEDVRTAQVSCAKESENGVFTASSPRDKDAVFVRYRASVISALSEEEESEICASFFRALGNEEEKMIPGLVAHRREEAKQSGVCRDVAQKDLFHAIDDALEDDTAALLGVVFGKASPGFAYDEVTAREVGAEASVRFLAGEGLAAKLDETAEDDVARCAAVNRFLMENSPMLTAAAEISHTLSHRTALAVGTVYGLRFSDLPVLREGTSGGLWYEEYVKSYSFQNRYNTAMWSSHIFSNDAVRRDLPFVRKAMQEERQIRRVRAMLGMMTDGSFTVVRSEKDPGAFVYGNALDYGAPLAFPDGTEIAEGDYASLYQWVLQDDERVAEADRAYGARFDELCRKFTTVEGIFCPIDEIVKSVCRTSFFRMFSNNILEAFPKTGGIPIADVFDVIAPFTGSEKQLSLRDTFLAELTRAIVALCACRRDSMEEYDMPDVIREAISAFAEGHPAAKKKMLAFAAEA